jgi:hypothetical protein
MYVFGSDRPAKGQQKLPSRPGSRPIQHMPAAACSLRARGHTRAGCYGPGLLWYGLVSQRAECRMREAYDRVYRVVAAQTVTTGSGFGRVGCKPAHISAGLT